jgi:hypothetical protein
MGGLAEVRVVKAGTSAPLAASAKLPPEFMLQTKCRVKILTNFVISKDHPPFAA